MTDYRLLNLSTLTPLEPAGPLPAWLVAANPSEAQIADLGWSGRTGQGYFRIIVADDPAFDPDTHRLSDPVEGKPDPDTKTIPAVREVVALTAEEIATRNPVPASISDRQFFQALAIRELISEPEALAAVKTGAIPAQLQAAVDTITDEAQHFAAVMLISGATVFERAHPMAAMLGAAIGKDSADLDDLWRFGATL